MKIMRVVSSLECLIQRYHFQIFVCFAYREKEVEPQTGESSLRIIR